MELLSFAVLVIGGWMGAGAAGRKRNMYIRKLIFLVVFASVLKLVVDFVQNMAGLVDDLRNFNFSVFLDPISHFLKRQQTI